MIKYEDYFPKSILNKCGILPETKLISEDELLTITSDRVEGNINKLIDNVYTNFKKSSIKNNNLIEEFKKFNINRRIISMLCDLDIISDIDKEKYLYNAEQKEIKDEYIDNNETRVSIELPELDAISINKKSEKSEKVIYSNKLQLEVKGKQK